MDKTWLFVFIWILLVYMFPRTFHVTLKRRVGVVSVEITTKILGVLTISTRRFHNITGARLERDSHEPACGIILSTGSGDVLVNNVCIRSYLLQMAVDKINYFVNGHSRDELSIVLNPVFAVIIFMAIVWGGSLFVLPQLSVRSDGGEAHVSEQKPSEHNIAAKNHMQGEPDSARPIRRIQSLLDSMPDDFPDGAYRPTFCKKMDIRRDELGGRVSLLGVMDLDIMIAGDMVNAYMINSPWEPHDMIKQSDAAALAYLLDDLSLTYTFVITKGKPNTCIINWQPIDYNKNYNAIHGIVVE